MKREVCELERDVERYENAAASARGRIAAVRAKLEGLEVGWG